MNKLITLCFISFLLVGCVKPAIVYKDVAYPVYVVPAPPVVTRPVLIIDTLTPDEAKDPGTVLRAQRATSEQKNGYIAQLELIVSKYSELAVSSKANLDKMLGPLASALPPQTLDSVTTEEWKTRMAPVPTPETDK